MKYEDIPCNECLLFPVCIEPNRFSDTFYGCDCPHLENWIADFQKRQPIDSRMKGTYAVVEWYKARTGIKL